MNCYGNVFQGESEAGADCSTGILGVDRVVQFIGEDNSFEQVKIGDFAACKATEPSTYSDLRPRFGPYMIIQCYRSHLDSQRCAARTKGSSIGLRCAYKGFVHGVLASCLNPACQINDEAVKPLPTTTAHNFVRMRIRYDPHSRPDAGACRNTFESISVSLVYRLFPTFSSLGVMR